MDPVTAAIGVGVIGAAATLVGAAATVAVGAGTLGYTIHHNRKDKPNKDTKYPTSQVPRTTYDPNREYRPSLSIASSGTEQFSFGPDGRFLAVGTDSSSWSCGTISYHAQNDDKPQSSGTQKQKKRGIFSRRKDQDDAPPPYWES